MLTHLSTILGRRGAALLLLGAIWAAVGWSTLDNPRPPTVGASYLWYEDIPTMLVGSAWLLTGLIGCSFAFTRRPGRDRWGFTSLVFLPLVRFTSSATAWVVYLASGGDEGYRYGAASALIWIALVLLVILIAGWDEPEQIPHPDPERWPR